MQGTPPAYAGPSFRDSCRSDDTMVLAPFRQFSTGTSQSYHAPIVPGSSGMSGHRVSYETTPTKLNELPQLSQVYRAARAFAFRSQDGDPASTHAASKEIVRYPRETLIAIAPNGLCSIATFPPLRDSTHPGVPYKAMERIMSTYKHRQAALGPPRFGSNSLSADVALINLGIRFWKWV